MRHPVTGKRLDWQWIVDFYHASERLHTMGAALFGEGRAAFSWARRMAKLLKKPNGPFRVLHAAAAAKANQTMNRAATKKFQTAFNYLRARSKYMQYPQITLEKPGKNAHERDGTLPDAMQFFQKINGLKPEERKKGLGAYRPKAHEKLAAVLK